MTPPRDFAFTVRADEQGARLDRVCAERLAGEGVSRSLVARLCELGQVRVGDHDARPAQRMKTGEQVRVRVPPPEPVRAEPEDIPLRVLYEDAAVLVVDKPAGLVVHPARGHATGTLVNAVLFHADVDDDADALRPGVVHRLDKDTSGALVVAKTAAAREGLAAQFKAHTIVRSYVALALGSPPDRVTYDTLHGRHPTDRQRFTTRVREGRRAVTHVTVEERLLGREVAWVRCALETGRTHQIRVHLAEAGHALLGDPVYGRRPTHPLLQRLAAALGRQALHAEVLGFVHPITGESLRFVATLPDDLATALDALRAASGPRA